MFEIDKQKFGAFVAQLRRDRGLTQKELGARLYLSDKAVSKWETGVSLPDTALLIPLAKLLEVSVTELLLCQRQEPDHALAPEAVEGLVKKAISYPGEGSLRSGPDRKLWTVLYLLALLLGFSGAFLLERAGLASETVMTMVVLSAVFGGYFCLFVRRRLPSLYDEHPMGLFVDGPIRMHIPGLRLHNSNWMPVVTAIRVWTCLALALFPWAAYVLGRFTPSFWFVGEKFVLAAVMLSLVLPIYIVGKKYE